MSDKLKQLITDFPQTVFWMDSMVVENIQYGLDHGMLGVTTSPTVMSDSILAEPETWKKEILEKQREFPEKNQFELIWEAMCKLTAERSKLVLPMFKNDSSIDGRFCIQANVYDFMNAEKVVTQAKRIHAVGKNLVIKIPTTEAGIEAMEEVVYQGISVMATATSTVSQVMAAGAALYRGLARREAEGLSNEGIALACAMQLGLPEMCYTNYSLEHGLAIDSNVLAYSSVAVAKKCYQLLLKNYPLVTFVLSNFETDLHWLEFMGARMMLTMPIEWLEKLDAWDGVVENRIDVPVDPAYIEELRTKIPFYHLAYDEEALTPENFSKFEGFCRSLNLFTDVYEKGVNKVREMLLPDPYRGNVEVKY